MIGKVLDLGMFLECKVVKKNINRSVKKGVFRRGMNTQINEKQKGTVVCRLYLQTTVPFCFFYNET